jgi:hypothetical protein
MYNISDSYLDAYKAPARHIVGRVECQTQNCLINMESNGSLIKFTIEKTSPKGKLFGFAISQKITIEAIGILDTIKRGDKLIPSIESADHNEEEVLLPHFYVDTVELNKVNNRTTINGYDILHKLDSIPISNFEFTYPVFALNYALDILEPIGGYVEFDGINQLIKEQPNLSGTETARSVLTALAEYTGSICYVSREDQVKFRSIKPEDFTDVLTADDYFDLTIGEEVRLNRIASSTELGDNYAYGSEGFTQVLWENPFINMSDNVSGILETIGNQVLNTSSVSYTLSWRGCPAYELGDFVILQEKDGTAQYARYLNESITYGGGLKATSEWDPGDNEIIDAAPSNLGEMLKSVYAKVDKVNKEIELVVSEKIEEALKEGEINATIESIVDEKMSSIEIDTEGITQTVMNQTQELIDTNMDGIEDQIQTLREEVSMGLTAEDVKIIISQTVDTSEATSVTTSTGFTFNEEGLEVSKSGSEMTTLITEDGMTVYRDDDAVLIADNVGVQAENLHATTYLIIGLNSRFEDYDEGQRTGCFWIGG